MPQQTKIFRVFVSSTFNDMKMERSLLQEKVFPELEKLCRQNGARFQGIDLRWGVSEESQRNQKTMDICLNEISRCQQITPKPNFIVLLGDRYGWQPVPAKIPEIEYDILLPYISTEDQLQLQNWYKLDTNAIPAEYVLQPRRGSYSEYTQWQPVETKLRMSLREAALKADLDEEALIKYTTSATHQEIIQGAFKPSPDANAPENHVLVLSRSIRNLPENATAEDFIDLNHGLRDDYSKSQLDGLKKELAKKLGQNFIEYIVDWNGGKEPFPDQDRFTEKAFVELIVNRLGAVINAQLKDPPEDELQMDIRFHYDFAASLTPYFTGRQLTLDQIFRHLNNPKNNKVLSLIGDSGTGKTCVMARVLELAGPANAVLVARFIGSNAQSSNLISILISICSQLAQAYGKTLQDLIGEFQNDRLFDYNTLTQLLSKGLALATLEKPQIILLDALDQLSDIENDRLFSWLPRELPDHVHFLVSCTCELSPALEGTHIIYLPLMPKSEGEYLLDTWLNAKKRKLTNEQKKEVIDKFNQNGLPLYLKILFEQAQKWHSYDPPPQLSGSIHSIIEQFMTWLEQEHSQLLVSKSVGYILSGKNRGLAENEIIELLAFDEQYWEFFLKHSHPAHLEELRLIKRLPTIVWSRLFLDLAPYLTEKDSFGERIVGFYHRQFETILKQKYLNDNEPFHKKLAEYYSNQNYWMESPDIQYKISINPTNPRLVNIRKLIELPWQLMQIKQYDQLGRLFIDISFLEAKTEAGMIFDLADDFSKVIQIIPGGHPIIRILNFLEEAIRRNIHFIFKHPTSLFQCLWNTCWWYDCPDALNHYEKTNRGIHEFSYSEDQRLCTLLQKWRIERQPQSIQKPWARSRRPPLIRLGLGQQMVFQGHCAGIKGLAVQSHYKLLASASWDGTVKVWNYHSGKIITTILTGNVEDLAFSSDGLQLAIVTNQHVKFFKLPSGKMFSECKVPQYESIQIKVDFINNRIICCGKKGNAQILDLHTFEKIQELPLVITEAEKYFFSEDGRYIAILSVGNLHIFDLQNEIETGCIQKINASTLAVSTDGKIVAAGDNKGILTLWNVNDKKIIFSREGHRNSIESLCFSSNNKYLASAGGLTDNTVRLWSLGCGVESGKEPRCIRGHQDYVNTLAFSDNDRFLFTGSIDRTIKKWDVASTDNEYKLIDHQSPILGDQKFSPDGRSFISMTVHDEQIAWDSESGLPCMIKSGDRLVGLDTLNGTINYTTQIERDSTAIIGEDGRAICWLPGELKFVTFYPLRHLFCGHEQESSHLQFYSIEWGVTNHLADFDPGETKTSFRRLEINKPIFAVINPSDIQKEQAYNTSIGNADMYIAAIMDELEYWDYCNDYQVMNYLLTTTELIFNNLRNYNTIIHLYIMQIEALKKIGRIDKVPEYCKKVTDICEKFELYEELNLIRQISLHLLKSR